MPQYKGTYYKPTLVKAKRDYDCALTLGRVIEAGDYYLHLSVQAGEERLGKFGTNYIPTDTIRVSIKTLAEMSMESIMYRVLKMYKQRASENKRISQLTEENQRLKQELARTKRRLLQFVDDEDDEDDR